MDHAQAKHFVRVLSASWAHTPLDPTTGAIWAKKLLKYDYDAVTAVLDGLLETSKFRPSLAEIVGPLTTRTRKTAAAAFQSVWEQIPKRPHDVTPAEQTTVDRMGGWAEIGEWQLAQRQWKAKAFAEIYEGVADDEETSERLALIGSGQRAIAGDVSSA